MEGVNSPLHFNFKRMKSLAKYVYSVKEKLSSLEMSDDLDQELDNEFVVDILNQVNATLMKEAYEHGRLTPDLYTPTCCLEVKCASEAECVVNGLAVPTNGIIHYVEIDNLIPGIPLSTAIRYLGLSDYSNPIHIADNIVTWSTWENRGASKHKPVGYLIGNRMYLKNIEMFTSSVRFLCILALIANPSGMCDFNDEESIYRTPSPQKLEYLAFRQIAMSLGLNAGDMVNNTSANVGGQRAVPQQEQEEE